MSNGDVSTNGMTKLRLKCQNLKALLKLNMEGVWQSWFKLLIEKCNKANWVPEQSWHLQCREFILVHFGRYKLLTASCFFRFPAFSLFSGSRVHWYFKYLHNYTVYIYTLYIYINQLVINYIFYLFYLFIYCTVKSPQYPWQRSPRCKNGEPSGIHESVKEFDSEILSCQMWGMLPSLELTASLHLKKGRLTPQ